MMNKLHYQTVIQQAEEDSCFLVKTVLIALTETVREYAFALPEMAYN
ncbi:hypothetical protein [cf. Phormidesmis sp. LEGE 11477]|nr:hypothetical protein [cf. Phormidesmis sp. LEGE 11477]MBE9064688.1 hypothetical protein [cf. Phormidesmis sp. LEGE 11477]